VHGYIAADARVPGWDDEEADEVDDVDAEE
jgi:hypothetical protein